MQTSREAHKRPIELRVVHGRGCNPQVCENIDELTEVCTDGAVLRLKAGLAWRYMMRAEGTPQEAFNNWFFERAKRSYFAHIYGNTDSGQVDRPALAGVV